MALQTSGPITLKEIGTEFGTSPTLKSNYGNGGVSSSGDITIKEFYGTSARTDSILTYAGGPFAISTVGYSVHQTSLTSAVEHGGNLAGTPGMAWAGCYTNMGGDRFFGFDQGAATELGNWYYVKVEWGIGGIQESYGLYDWYDAGPFGSYYFAINPYIWIDDTDIYGDSLLDYCVNNWGFVVTFDNRI